MALIQDGAGYAAARAGGHFYKGAPAAALCHILQHPHTVFDAVHGKVGIIPVFAIHGADDAAAGGEGAGAAGLVFGFFFFDLDARFIQPGG